MPCVIGCALASQFAEPQGSVCGCATALPEYAMLADAHRLAGGLGLPLVLYGHAGHVYIKHFRDRDGADTGGVAPGRPTREAGRSVRGPSAA